MAFWNKSSFHMVYLIPYFQTDFRNVYYIQADKARSRIVKKSSSCGISAITKALNMDASVDDSAIEKALKSAHFNTDDRQMREIDMAMRNQTNEIQNSIVK